MTLSIIADIGGTNARFALVSDLKIVAEADYKCADFETITEAAQKFLKDHADFGAPRLGVFAVAGPVDGDDINLTNLAWKFSCKNVAEDLNLESLEVMNDFKAVALGILHVSDSHKKTVYAGAGAQNKKPIAILGPGTGLGVASLVCAGDDYIAVDGEGGHVTMPATNMREFKIFEQMHSKYHHISAERVCSGKGLENLYAAICALDNITPDDSINAAMISERGQKDTCKICAESLDLMCAFLGRVAGNLALILKAQGGVYIAGGIPPKLGDYFLKSRFVDEYTSKGRMSDVVKSIPVYMIDHPSVGMVGLKHYAHARAQNL